MGFSILEQTFSLLDVPKLFLVIFLECILSVDNALAIALIVKKLPENKRQKALWIGVFSSLLLRGLALVFAAYFLHIFWFQFLGGLYLIYLGSSFFFKKNTNHIKTYTKSSFWKVVVLVELTDFAFAIDSIIAAVGVITITSSHTLPPNLWIVYVGGISGLLLMRLASKGFVKLVTKYNQLELFAHCLILLIGIKLGLTATLKEFSIVNFHKIIEISFWSLSVFLLLISYLLPIRKKP